MTFTQAIVERNLAPDWLTRITIRKVLAEQLAQESSVPVEKQIERKMAVIDSLKSPKLVDEQHKANVEYYELPTAFFQQFFGKRIKYSSSYFENPSMTLDQAETAMLKRYCECMGLKDGMNVLDIGCGWGSLILYIAENYPNCTVTGLTNSTVQVKHIEDEARANGYSNIRAVVGDVMKVEDVDGATSKFDRVVCVEVFEHCKNYQQLLQKIASWLHDDGKLFVEIICHNKFTYHLDLVDGADEFNWMGKHFFAGITMPCDDIFCYFQDHVKIAKRWRVDGKHYAKTCKLWLQNFDRNIQKVRPMLADTYGASEATKWEGYWRTFLLSLGGQYGYNGGQEWHLAHYLFDKRI